jgi:EAL domain-containing protein (putative c-di-GMP-specific phosphodiesterase class I)/GGDEF domain-containing protein
MSPSLSNPVTEASRLDALHRLNLLDTPPNVSFDRITRMASRLFGLPLAAVSLTDVDRQWFKSRVGIVQESVPRLKAPCARIAESGQMVIVKDLQADSFYADSPLAGAGVRFYAGAPLLTNDGYCLGSMCVLGTEPRDVTEAECAALRDMAAMVMAQIELQHALGRIDPVSGLPNRTQFVDDFNDLTQDRPAGEQRVAGLLNLASPEQLSSALRAMGASWLDEVVGEAVRMLAGTIGASGTVYHVTPTEFAFITVPDTDIDAVCAEMEAWLAQRAVSATSRFVTTARIGMAPFTIGVTGSAELLRNLHSAAQHAFDQDRGVSVFSQEQDALYRRSFWLINAFGAALDGAAGADADGQLRLVFQPKVDLVSGACIGAEALLRWTHPELGDVSPGEFIPIIERTSMVRATTDWVLRCAMRQLAAWRADGLELELAVNVSVVNLLEPDFCTRIVDNLRSHGLPASSLALEITESALMKNPKVAEATMRDLHDAGVRLAIDDFGTGYSSLSYLQSLPAQVVKIDQSFVRGIEDDERKRSLVSAMIKLSHDLGHRVVAEGVETAEVAGVLKGVACDEAQGYWYAKPLAPGAFVAWLAGRGSDAAKPA